MPNETSEVFKVLSVETRIKIIELLKTRGPLGVNKLAEILNITPAAVSQHLKTLRYAGLVTSERKGYRIPYSLNEDAMENCRSILNHVCACGCHGGAEMNNEELTKLNLEDLKSYEKDLKNRLKKVQLNIAQMTPSKG